MYQNHENNSSSFWDPIFEGFGEVKFGSILGALWNAFETLCEAFGTLWESIGSFTKPSVGRWVSLGLRVSSLHFLIHLVILYSADVLQIMTCIQQVGHILSNMFCRFGTGSSGLSRLWWLMLQ